MQNLGPNLTDNARLSSGLQQIWKIHGNGKRNREKEKIDRRTSLVKRTF
jgi:hypothetical protein